MDLPTTDPQGEREALPYQTLPNVPVGQPFSLLSGITVLDLTNSVAGPYATMLLADLGADVIKVERPEGDETRAWGPPFLDEQSLWFTAINRNKKSVVIDMLTPEGLADLRRLVRSADVFVTNMPPNVQRKIKIEYEALRVERDDLVFVSITGFGLSGPRAQLRCYDLIAEGYSGIMDITGEENSWPQKIGAPAADMLAGQDAAMAVCAALFERKASGKGHKIEVSLVESMTRMLTCRITPYLGSGEVPRRSGGQDSVIAIYRAFATADKPLNLALGSDAIWTRFWQVVGDPDYGGRPEFSSNAKRRVVRVELVERIQTLLKARGRDAWLELFEAAGVPAGPIYSVDEVTADGPLRDRGLFFALQDGSGRTVPQVGLGIHIDGDWSVPRSAPPRLGEHTAEFLPKPA
jgi:crotonobetainyl-CoA:carnitine CoA-transferase CaiB-like acyl-CoA transferase